MCIWMWFLMSMQMIMWPRKIYAFVNNSVCGERKKEKKHTHFNQHTKRIEMGDACKFAFEIALTDCSHSRHTFFVLRLEFVALAILIVWLKRIDSRRLAKSDWERRTRSHKTRTINYIDYVFFFLFHNQALHSERSHANNLQKKKQTPKHQLF